VTQPRPPDTRLLSAVLLGVSSGAILVPLNSTMLAVALPGIGDEFGLGANTVSSLVTLYLGVVAVALPIGGSIGDRWGHRSAFLLGVIGFAIASAVAAVANSFELLEVSRVAQAASGALISTSSAALVRETAPDARRGEAFGLFDLLVSTSAAVGPFIGGLLVGAFGWRSMFVLAVPIGIVSAGFVGIGLRPSAEHHAAEKQRRSPTIDVIGLTLLALAIVAFLVALRSEGATGTVAALAIVPLGVAFVAVELGATGRPSIRACSCSDPSPPRSWACSARP
jgi:MFS family permease